MQPPPASDRSAEHGVPVVTLDLQIAHSDTASTTEQNFVPSYADCCAWVAAVLAEHQIDAAELTIRTVDITESQSLNSTYRGKDTPTNVLSFPFDATIPLPVRLLGDLVICVPVMTSEADEQGKPVLDHWAHLIIHGTLHLLGYDHIDEHEAEHMERLEADILAKFNIANPYFKECFNGHE